MTALTNIAQFSASTNFSRYLREIQNYPMLEDGEEITLARKYHKGDMEAGNKLITSHLRLVAKIADGYRGYGLPMGEIVSEGNVGLIQAVNRFDPEKGFKLATYAIWWIKASIQEYILHSWSLVKIGTTASQKKLFFNLRKIKNKLKIFDERELSDREVNTISNKLSVSTKDVRSMNIRMGGQDHSLNAPINTDNQGEWQDWLTDKADTQEEEISKKQEYKKQKLLLLNAVKVLNERERAIIMERRLKEKATTLEDLSQRFNVSRERIRQIEVRAIQKLQKEVKDQISKRNFVL